MKKITKSNRTKFNRQSPIGRSAIVKKIITNGMLGATGLMMKVVTPVKAILDDGARGSGGSSTDTNIFGTIKAPAGVAQYDARAAEGGASIGLLLFVSNLIKLSVTIAGIWAMFNFILAGWTYITSNGDAKANATAASKMTNTLVGLIIIVSAYTIAGLIGLIFFGDASYIISPQIQGI